MNAPKSEKSASKRRLSEILSVSPESELSELREWNNTSREFPRGSIVELFQAVSAQRSSEMAYDTIEGLFSYAHIEVRSNRIAARLIKMGVSTGCIVAICVPRSADYLSAILGVFKTGCAYVPIDPAFPKAHIEKILDDCSTRLIITDETVLHRFQFGAVRRVLILNDALNTELEMIQPVPISPDMLAYVMYTSGSTGRPKGVMVHHLQITNWLFNLWQVLPFQSGEVVAQKTVCSFVVSLKEMLAGLLSGTPTIVIPDETVRDPRQFLEVLALKKVTRLNIVPSHLQSLIATCGDQLHRLGSLRYCITAGEPLTRKLRDDFREKFPHVMLWNNYGCTELNDVTYCAPNEQDFGGDFVPIGRPIANTQVYILDNAFRLVPNGVVGELCVAGAPVGLGYVDQPTLTAEKFVANPFDAFGQRMYRTGDLARLLPNGLIEYIGRTDFEVKIRGHRIDVRYIENILNEMEGLSQCVVCAVREDQGGSHLTAFYILKDARLTPSAIREFLHLRLPAYMVPTEFMPVQEFPRLQNGKLDRLSLSRLTRNSDSSPLGERPHTPFEAEVKTLFETTLQRKDIAPTQNFFDLGGHSLSAVALLSEIRKRFGVDIPLIDFIERPTARAIAQAIQQLTKFQNQDELVKPKGSDSTLGAILAKLTAPVRKGLFKRD